MNVAEEKWLFYPQIKIVTAKKQSILASKADFIQHLENDEELLKLYGGTISNLFVCSNTFSFSFEMLKSIMPLSKILNIVCSLPKSSSKYVNPSIWLEFTQEKCGIQFKIPVCQYDGDFLLNYDFTFQSPFSTKMALQLFTQSLDIEYEGAFIADSKSEIFESDYLHFLKAIKSERIFFVAKLTKKKVKRIKERINTIKEILDSEISYNIRLQKIKDIASFFEQYSILDNETQALFQSLVDSLFVMSNNIKSKLSAYTSYYMVPLGKIFIKFTTFIPVYVRYAEILKEAMIKFRENLKDPLFQTIVNKYQSEPYFEMLSIEQYLHEPEQRLPRYRLLVQRVFEETPWGHPDKILLMSVVEKFNNERIKNNDECLFDQATLAKYPEELNQYVKYLPLEAGQGYIGNFKVIFDGKESIVVLYSSDMRILTLSTNIAKMIDYRQLRILHSEEQDECIIYVFNFEYAIKFNTHADMKSFIKEIKEACYMSQLKEVTNSVGLNWNNKFAKCPLHLQHHSMAELKGNIYIFGGIDEKGLLSSSFIFYTIKSDEWHFYENDNLNSSLRPRKDASMISMNDKIYLFGGYSENMEPLNDLWSFDGIEWKLIDSEVKLTDGGFFAATKFTNDRILFVGGHKKTQTLTFDVKNEAWAEICQSSEIQSMKYHNVSFCPQSGTVLLFGGMSMSTEEPVKDLYVLDVAKNMWVKNSADLIGQFPTPRYGNLMLSLKSYIFILGGIGSSSPFVLKSNNFFNLIRNEGSFPTFDSFASACIVDDEIWAFGGITEDGTSNILYKITLIRDQQ